MPKPIKQDQVKKWYVYCTECEGGYVVQKGKPTECPNDSMHVIDRVKKYGAHSQGVVMSSPDGSLWMLYIEDNGQLRTEKL